jgi:moderate conductance mechanosensitive channel
MWRRLFEGPIDIGAVLLALVPTVIAGYLAARAARRLAAAGLRALVRDTLSHTSPLVQGPLRLVASAAFIFVVAIVLFPAFEIAGLRPRSGIHLRTLAAWSFTSGLRVVLIVILAYALLRMTTLVVQRFEHEMSAGSDLDAIERGKRARTLGSVVRNVMSALIVGVAALMVLREFQVDIAPVLTGAGIVGLAVGFGAQTLVRDIISGFFLILENQVRVGDSAAINGTAGTIEAINLRTIVLRDGEGTVHVFPNGGINTLANKSKDFSYTVIPLSVSYYDDPDRVEQLVREIGAEIEADPRYRPWILEPVEVLGVDALGEWAMVMKVRMKTVPQKQDDVGRELRRRIVKAFDANGLAFPFPVASTAVRPSARHEERQ